MGGGKSKRRMGKSQANIGGVFLGQFKTSCLISGGGKGLDSVWIRFLLCGVDLRPWYSIITPFLVLSFDLVPWADVVGGPSILRRLSGMEKFGREWSIVMRQGNLFKRKDDAAGGSRR